MDCVREYEECTAACEVADERILKEDTYQPAIAGGQACPAAQDCMIGQGDCSLGSDTTQMLTAVDVGDDDTGYVAAIAVLGFCVAGFGIYVALSKKNNKPNQLQADTAAALNDLTSARQPEQDRISAQDFAGTPAHQRSPSDIPATADDKDAALEDAAGVHP